MKRELSKRKFVEAASEILASEGVEALTTRRIGRELGCNSAGTYYYFKDLDELIAYAAMGTFSEYLIEVSECVRHSKDALAAYRGAWECLIDRSSDKPWLIEKVLYGKYSDDLGKISASYFQLFPEKKALLESTVAESITDEAFSGRVSHLILGRLVREDWISKEDAEILGEICRWMHTGMLRDLCFNRISGGELREKFFCCMDRMITAFRRK